MEFQSSKDDYKLNVKLQSPEIAGGAWGRHFQLTGQDTSSWSIEVYQNNSWKLIGKTSPEGDFVDDEISSPKKYRLGELIETDTLQAVSDLIIEKDFCQRYQDTLNVYRLVLPSDANWELSGCHIFIKAQEVFLQSNLSFQQNSSNMIFIETRKIYGTGKIIAR